MSEAAARTGASRSRAPWSRAGIAGAVLSVTRGLALAAVALADLVLLAVPAGAVLLTALGLFQLVHTGPAGSEGADTAAIVIGLVAVRFAVPAALLGIRRLALLTRQLSWRWCGVRIGSAYAPRPAGTRAGRVPGTARLGYQQRMGWLLGDPETWRDLLWAAVSSAGTIVLLAPAALVAVGTLDFIVPGVGSYHWARERFIPPPAFPANTPPNLIAIGLVLVALGLWTAPALLRGYGVLAWKVLSPSEQAVLERRVAHLAQTRKETLDTGAAELRRIERDLHDGAQARLVAMGLTLDAAGRLIESDPQAARALLYEARDASAKALVELRNLVRGIHPPVLADRGLAEAVRALALDTPLPVRVTGSLPGRPPAPVESAAYFAVSELFANVAKHADAQRAEVDLRHADGALRISVYDDGAGGADPALGTGLQGIARRLAAFDGVFVLNSPPGGPTVVTMEVPCALS